MDTSYFKEWLSQYQTNKGVVPEHNIVQDNFIELASGQIRFIDLDRTNRPTCILVVESCAENYWKVIPFSTTKIPIFKNEYATGIEGYEVLELWNCVFIEYDILKAESYYVDEIDETILNEVRMLYQEDKIKIPESVQQKRGPIKDLSDWLAADICSAIYDYAKSEFDNLIELNEL